MTAEKNTWQVGFRRGAVQALVVAVIFYLLIDTLALCIPRNPAEVSTRDVVLYFLRMHFILMGVIATVVVAFDWFAKFKKFLALRRTQRRSMS